VSSPPKTELNPKNNDSFTAWRIYERSVTELAPKFDAFVDASDRNRIAWASLERSMRAQNYCIVALTLAVLALVWRM
jgi:hypothetical protein